MLTKFRMRTLTSRATVLACYFLMGSATYAQTSPEDIASLLASIRALKTECRIKPVPSRLHALVGAAGYRLEDFLPGRRFYPSVQSALDGLPRSVRGNRAEICDRLAERVRTSPLNTPNLTSAERMSGPRYGAVDLNRASPEELNSLGAGMIGRTIIYGRPYSSPEDLIDRRLLNLRDFARIRGRITVR